MNPQFPIFIPSKGRWDKQKTMSVFDGWKTPYRIIIEESEYDKYEQVFGKDKLIVLDHRYKEQYELCDEHGLSKSTGSGPARNMAWDLAASEGAEYFWVIDDNIRGFYRRNHSLRDYCGDGTMMRACEDFVLRYENVAMAGPDYHFFSSPQQTYKPFLPNTRIYSCAMVRTDLDFRFRGRYNEDQIISLDILKAGWSTILFKAFLQIKMETQTLKGGNTDEFYALEGTLDKSRMLVREHPDCARLVFRYNRWHHQVDHDRFLHRNRLKKKPGLAIKKGDDNYGMVYKRERTKKKK